MVLTGLVSSEAALGLHMAVLLLYLPVSFLHCVSVSWSPLIRTLTSWVRVYSCVHFILPQLSLKLGSQAHSELLGIRTSSQKFDGNTS